MVCKSGLPLRSSCITIFDDPSSAYFPGLGEERLQFRRTETSRELHHKDGSSVTGSLVCRWRGRSSAAIISIKNVKNEP